MPGAWCWVLGGQSGDVAGALSELNAHLSPACHLTSAGALALSQRELSQRIDAASWGSQLDAATPVDKATLLSEATPGARAFLTCVPSGRTKMEPAVFNAELRARLRVPESGTDTWCPKCDAILDTYMAITLRCAWLGGESPPAQCLAWPSLFLVWARVPPPRTRKSWLAVAPAAGWREKCPPQACWCLPPSFPQLISPLRRPSGWMSWARRVGPRLPRCTRTTRRGTSTLLQLARLNMLSFSRWWPRLLAPGRLKRPRLLTISAVLPAMEALCFRRPVCSFALGGPVRLCAGELSWKLRSGWWASFAEFFLWEPPLWNRSAVTGIIGPCPAFAPCFPFAR